MTTYSTGHKIKFGEGRLTRCVGRHGDALLSGLQVQQLTDVGLDGETKLPNLYIRPLTSRGQVSYNCLVEIPVRDLPALVKVLMAVYEDYFGPDALGVKEVRAPEGDE